MLLLTDGVANSWRKGALLHWMIAYPSRVSAQGINVSVVCVYPVKITRRRTEAVYNRTNVCGL